MELFGVLCVPNIIVWIIGICILIYLYGTWSFSFLSSYGFKGPKPVPFLGNLLMLFPKKNEHFGQCDRWLKKKYGKFVALYLGRQPDVVVYDPEVLKHILVKDFTNFTNRRDMLLRGIFKKSMFDATDNEWRRVRGLASPFFTTSKLKHHMSLVNVCVNHMVEAVEKNVDKDGRSKEPVEAKKLLGDFTMDSICQTAFGLDINYSSDTEHPVVTAARKIMNPELFTIPVFLVFIFPFLNKWLDKMGFQAFDHRSVNVLSQVVHAAIAERKTSNKVFPDFVQTLVKSHDIELDKESREAMGEMVDPTDRGKGLTDDEITANAVLFLLAGYDTTSSALTFLMLNMATHEDWQERVADEIDSLVGDQELTYDDLKHLTTFEMCLDESLRLYPPVFRADRKTSQDITINGRTFPKDCNVVFPIMAMHRDPEFWTDPDVFDPERFSPDRKKEIMNSYTYFPFGLGPRSCVGMRLALMEIKMAAVRLIQKYKWTVSDKTQLPITLAPTVFPVVQGGLWLEIERR